MDLSKPVIEHDKVECVKGDLTSLQFPDGAFDLVCCTEVLEHIPPEQVPKAAAEITRVAKNYVIIGVPYKQDLRVGRTTCYRCGMKNPPWGHVNSFKEEQLIQLFFRLKVRRISFAGQTNARTNHISTLLMDLAGNPYGTYSQEEPCVNCGTRLTNPPPRTFLQKLCAKTSFWINRGCALIVPPQSRAKWLHILFSKDH